MYVGLVFGLKKITFASGSTLRIFDQKILFYSDSILILSDIWPSFIFLSSRSSLPYFLQILLNYKIENWMI